MIHVITSHNHPDLHFEFNEAWVLDRSAALQKTAFTFNTKIIPDTIKQYSEHYPNGKTKVTWTAGIGTDGHYLLHGTQICYYKNGQTQWETNYNAGQRTGTETYWSKQGQKQWQKVYADDRTYEWTTYTNDQKVRAKSKWNGKILLSHKIAGK